MATINFEEMDLVSEIKVKGSGNIGEVKVYRNENNGKVEYYVNLTEKGKKFEKLFEDLDNHYRTPFGLSRLLPEHKKIKKKNKAEKGIEKTEKKLIEYARDFVKSIIKGLKDPLKKIKKLIKEGKEEELNNICIKIGWYGSYKSRRFLSYITETFKRDLAYVYYLENEEGIDVKELATKNRIIHWKYIPVFISSVLGFIGGIYLMMEGFSSSLAESISNKIVDYLPSIGLVTSELSLYGLLSSASEIVESPDLYRLYQLANGGELLIEEVNRPGYEKLSKKSYL